MPLTAIDPEAGGVYDYAAMHAGGCVDFFVPMAYQQQYGKNAFATGSISKSILTKGIATYSGAIFC